MITVEIWSDLVCPFCYIGKRNFESALKKFAHKEKVTVVWKSFELDPNATEIPGAYLHQMLAEKYGGTVEWAKGMTAQISRTAKEAGLTFAIERAAPANTFNAHRLCHLAAKHGLQDAAQERLFAAHFTEGRKIGDTQTLLDLAGEIGLDRDEAARLLAGNDYAADVRNDEDEGRKLGINSVPCFIINRKFAVRGAQPEAAFFDALNVALKGNPEFLPSA